MKKTEEIASRLAIIKKSLQATDLHTLTLRVEEVENLIEEYRSNLWTSPCDCNPEEKTGETWCCNHCGRPSARTESKELPNDEESGVIAVNVASNVKPKLTENEEAFFIAGFQECIKYLRISPLLASRDARIRELEEEEKVYEIDFAGNVKCRINVCNGQLKIEGAINGYGDGISLDEIIITPPKN